MKRIISIKEYIISSIIFMCLLLMISYNKFTIYNGNSIIVDGVSIYEANMVLYKITIISYIFVIIETVTVNKRIRRKNLKKIQPYKLISISILLTIIMSVHVAFWFSISRDLYIGVPVLLSSVLFLRILISNRVGFSDDYFSVNSKLYSINGLTSIEDDYSSTLDTKFVTIQSPKYVSF